MICVAYGPDSWLIRHSFAVGETAFQKGRAIAAAIDRDPPAGFLGIVESFTSLLIEFRPGTRPDGATLAARLDAAPLAAPGAGRDVTELGVHYDGADLERAAALARVDRAELVRLHTAPVYRVHAIGFSPGFPYLAGLDPRLNTPRLATPRPRVAAGSVAIGGEHTGVYPLAGPGGWNLLGRTDATLVDPGRDRVRFALGDAVRFAAVDRIEPPPPRSRFEPTGAPVLEVLGGAALSVQDAGRAREWRRAGVPRGGAIDPALAAEANRAAENPAGAPVLEIGPAGARFHVLSSARLAIARWGEKTLCLEAKAGDTVAVKVSAGVWSYLAVDGGFDAPIAFGSASAFRDAWGLAPVRGDRLHRAEGIAPREPFTEARSAERVRLFPGPEWESFDAIDHERLFTSDWKVDPRSSREGVRLGGSPLLSRSAARMISEPVLPGTIQIPEGGQPIVIMPDGPTVGGYPRIALVHPDDLARVAQTRPGGRLSFERIG